MKIAKEFKEFAMRGNVVDLAVGVIIGAAFGAIVKSVVDDLVMPLIAKALGNRDFSNLYLPLSDSIQKVNDHWPALAEARRLGPVFAYGNFLTLILNFLIIAACVFLLVKGINTLRRKEEAKPAAPTAPTTQEKLLMEIRDALRERR